MSDQPYIIYATDYFHGSAGVRVLHRLGHLLNEAGQKAYIYMSKTNKNWNISSITAFQAKILIENGAVVVYPEVVRGNPLFAKTVVRYILNKPGLLGGDKTYAGSEILFCYAKELLQPGMPADRVLCIPAIDTGIFYNDHQERDIDYLVYIGKHKNVRGYPEKSKLYRHKPNRQEELGKLLRRCNKLINYDNFTVLTLEATLCGCPVVIIPDGTRKREDAENNEFGFNGVAWGDSPEEFLKAQRTLPQSPAMLEILENNARIALRNFIAVTQKRSEDQKFFRNNKNKSVSIIILNYNGEECLKKNLPSVLENIDKEIPAEVILVDNGSTDKSAEYIKNNFPRVKVLQFDSPLGFARACNEGARAAKNDLLFFLNNDIQATPNFLPPLIKHFESQEVFGVSPKVIRPSQNNINESIIIGNFAGGIINARFAETQKLELPDLPLEVFSVCGAAMMIDRDKFFEIGGLDEMLRPFYYEETDLSYRALKRGWRIIYEPGSIVYHQHDQTIGKQFPKSLALWSYRKNQYLCVWKNITDPWLMTKHVIQMVIPKLLIPNLLEWKALFGAIKQLPEALKQRRPSLLTDREVFKQAAKQTRIIRLKAAVKNILVIRPDAIGDLVLTLPSVRSLKESFPHARITVLISKDTAPILKNNPDIDEIIFDYDLKKRKFDLSVNFYNQFKDTFATLRAGIPYRLGDSSRILTGWMNNLRIFRNWNDPNKHEVEQNYELLKPLGVLPGTAKPIINVSAHSLDRVNHLLEQKGLKITEKAVGIHIGSATSDAWSADNFQKVGAWLAQNIKCKIVLLCGEKEIKRAERFAALAAFPFINLAGQLDLTELIALISRLSFYLGMDTGPTHIAAALNVPLVMLCLNKNAKPTRWGPWLVRHLTVTARGNQSDIPVEKVIEAVKSVIAGGGVTTLEEARRHWQLQL